MDSGQRPSARFCNNRLIMDVSAPRIDVSEVSSSHSLLNRLGRVVWGIVWLLFFRTSPRILHGWRRLLLRTFGARIGRGVHVYPSTRIWWPGNLVMEDFSCLGQFVDCYCVDKIFIGSHATVSQYSYLCGASHDHEHPTMPLTTAPIVIEREAWVAADAFIGPGVTIGSGALVGARAVVVKNVAPWTIVAGNPAKYIKDRIIKTS